METLTLDHSKTIIQIGACRGDEKNDSISSYVKHNTRFHAFEPVPELHQSLVGNYTRRFPKNKFKLNRMAVGSKNGTIDMYVPVIGNELLPWFTDQLASSNEDHIKKHFENLSVIAHTRSAVEQEQIENLQHIKIEKLSVPCVKLDSYIEQNQISEIELLSVDTEGSDYDILMAFDFKIKPKYLIFEKKHIDGPLVSGRTRHKELHARLDKLGYQFRKSNGEDEMWFLS